MRQQIILIFCALACSSFSALAQSNDIKPIVSELKTEQLREPKVSDGDTEATTSQPNEKLEAPASVETTEQVARTKSSAVMIERSPEMLESKKIEPKLSDPQ